MSKQKELASSALHKELQRTISFCSLSKIKDKLPTLKFIERYEIMENDYHGDPDNEDFVPLLDQLLEGKNEFSGLFRQDDNWQASMQGFSQKKTRGTGKGDGVALGLKNCFTREYTKTYVIGISFTRESLTTSTVSNTNTGYNKLSGMKVFQRAEEAWVHGKKALVIAEEYLEEDDDGNKKLPSDTTIEDYDMHVLNEMWKQMKKRPNADDRPESWFFPGWFAFRLFGPYVEESMAEYKTDLFTMDTVAPKPNADAQTRAAKVGSSGTKKDKDGKKDGSSVGRPAGGGKSPFKRGLSFDQQMELSRLAQVQNEHRSRQQEDIISSLKQKLDSLTAQLKVSAEIAMKLTPDDMDSQFWEEYREIKQEIKDTNKMIEEKQSTSRKRSGEQTDFIDDFVKSYMIKAKKRKVQATPSE